MSSSLNNFFNFWGLLEDGANPITVAVIIAKGIHPFPSRTRKLSPSTPRNSWGVPPCENRKLPIINASTKKRTKKDLQGFADLESLFLLLPKKGITLDTGYLKKPLRFFVTPLL